MLKRPHVDEFLRRMGELFECVLFTASLAKVRLQKCFSLHSIHECTVNGTSQADEEVN